MKRQRIIRHTRRVDVDWSSLNELYQELQSMPAVARRLGTTEKITYNELKLRGVKLRPRGHVKGQKKTDTWREASSKNWNDPEWREQQRQKWLERLPSMRGNGKTSPLEQLLHEALKRARISFATHQPLIKRYIVDVLILQKPVVVEADGSSHYLRSAREKDAQRDVDLGIAGFKVSRIRYEDIASDPDECVRQLCQRFDLTAEDEPTFIISSDGEANASMSRERWRDPIWRAQHQKKLSDGQRRRRERERQMMVCSGLDESCEDVQNCPETR